MDPELAAAAISGTITGLIGVAGITATYLSGKSGRDLAVAQSRQQLEHALADRAHTEKRAAYVGYLEAIQGARHVLLRIRDAADNLDSSKQASELRTLALGELSLRRSHLQLAGPPSVRTLANDLHGHLAKTLDAALQGEPNAVDVSLVAALLAAMKDDLNYELAPIDRKALNESSHDAIEPS